MNHIDEYMNQNLTRGDVPQSQERARKSALFAFPHSMCLANIIEFSPHCPGTCRMQAADSLLEENQGIGTILAVVIHTSPKLGSVGSESGQPGSRKCDRNSQIS
jgi:hypothetical protein